ncbi:MAG: dTMP kinase [Bacillota bacterium]
MKKNKWKESVKQGILIAFEGISGSGKSEGVHKLSEYLINQGYGTALIEWNSNQAIRKLVKALCKKHLITPKIYSILQLISFLLDYLIRIVPYLRKNYIVIADRYVYTALTRDRVNGAGSFMGWLLYRLVRKPDMLFFYDTNPDICSQRIKFRGKALFHTNSIILNSKLLKNRNLYYLKKLRSEYVRLLERPEINRATSIIHIKDNVESIVEDVEGYLDKKINSKIANIVNNNRGMTNGKKAAKGCYTEKY